MDAQTPDNTLDSMPIDWLCINTMRTLAMDAVQQANSGHPGTPMALAPAGYVLWTRLLRHNPANPHWFNRDRFVLSAGHASMLLYSLLHLTGYELSLDEIRNFRQWGSRTPGHTEHGLTPGVEVTAGPLGQGLMNAVGMAMAEAHLAAVFNRAGHDIVDHHTYVFCSDGDLMEGASHEAASLAGHLGLGKLIVLYDDNHITIEGSTALAYSDDVAKRFEGYHWHVQNLGEAANDLDALECGFANAFDEKERPSLIIVRSHIAYGAPHAHDTAKAHGAPLGEEEVGATKDFYGWPHDAKFLVPQNALAHMRQALAKGDAQESAWQQKFAAYRKAYPELAAQFEAALDGTPPAGWEEAIPHFSPQDGPMATRVASGKVLNGIAGSIPWLMGGSGDLAPSTDTLLKDSGDFEKGNYHNRNLHWGIREHVMCAASSGMALHGGIRPFAATFLIFTDYARPAIRLAAMTGLPVIYVMTHDSIGLGEDGPTHQPVEHLASLRAMPNMCLIRPADANEVAYAWRAAISRMEGPTLLALTRQALPIFDRTKLAGAEGVLRGAYILSREKGDRPDIILMASGSEVQLVLEAQGKLGAEGIDARVVSMPSFELFRSQPADYRDEVLPPSVTSRLAVEAATRFGWCEWVNHGGMIGVDRYGASAPYRQTFKHLGLTVDNVVEKAKRVLAT
ncbi:MAG TPA: transketolase [Gallionella sp.]|nr:transketolase [Gallionella sp.]